MEGEWIRRLCLHAPPPPPKKVEECAPLHVSNTDTQTHRLPLSVLRALSWESGASALVPEPPQPAGDLGISSPSGLFSLSLHNHAM